MRILTAIFVASTILVGCRKKDDAASLRSACEQRGDLTSCNSLARMHFEGVGAPEDKDRAIELYDRACTGGSSNACANLNVLAGLYARGEGVPMDTVRAAVLYQAACKGGVTTACGSSPTR